MRLPALSALLALALAGCAAIPAPPQPAAAPPAASVEPQPAALSQLVSAVDIPFETFTLANGLKVIVHTDRKAPIVGVTTYYRVGSKHEPRGKTGFAHLFEHLMFTGSENVPNFDIPLEAAGSTPTNGTTWYDRTNYVEVVPTGALDRALMMESDRMGHLLGAVDQTKLDRQRGVVQNEKRQSDNQPYGLAGYALGEGLFPVGHPYRHSPIGSMADLDAASLDDVHSWFADNYGPNNVVLALTGDIDTATARPLVERWFGSIPAGPEVITAEAGPVTLPAPAKREMTDQVASIRLTRAWSGPGLADPDRIPLEIGMAVLGGLASSRLDNALVREQRLALSVSAEVEAHEQVSFITAQMDVLPGVRHEAAEAAFLAEIDRLVRDGPTSDEIGRAATRMIAGEIGALERVGDLDGKGATLAEGQLYRGDPAAYRADLAAIAAVTPEQVRDALKTWLTRPPFDLAVLPGERTETGEAMGGWGDEASAPQVSRSSSSAAATARAASTRSGAKRAIPPIAPVPDLVLPPTEHARLSNGIAVTLMRRTAVPKVLVGLQIDAGYSADRQDRQGLQSLMLDLLTEGTHRRTSAVIAEEQERLGAQLSTVATLDASIVTLEALSANLAPSLDLMADVALDPAFAPAEVERLRDLRLAEIAQNLSSPGGLAAEVLNPAIFGPDHPYGVPAGGLGSARVIASVTSGDISREHRKWFRPELAALTVVGDTTLAEILPLLERRFGGWGFLASAAPHKDIDAPVPPPRPRIIVIDRPNSPQSLIAGAKVLTMRGGDPDLAVDLANEVVGNGFLSRLNADLREDKGWSYGVGSAVRRSVGPRNFLVQTSVQADRTGDSLRLLIARLAEFPGKAPVTPDELNRVTDGNIRGLPNRYETNAQILSTLLLNQRLGRPDDWDATLASRYRAVDAKTLNAAAAAHLQPDEMVWVIVGDRAVIEPQLKGFTLPVEFVTIDTGVDNP